MGWDVGEGKVVITMVRGLKEKSLLEATETGFLTS